MTSPTGNPDAGPSEVPPGPVLPVRYGQLNSKETIFYFQGFSAQTLQAIIETAPRTIRRLPSDTSNVQALLAELLRLRQYEAFTQQPSPSESQSQLVTLLATPANDIIQMANENPNNLSALMNASLAADPSLTPRSLPTNAQTLAAIAIKWQLDALQQASQINTSQQPVNPPASANPPRGLPLSQLLTDIRPPVMQDQVQRRAPVVDTSDEEDDQLRKVGKSKRAVIQPTGFGFGAQAATTDLLKHYPGKGHSSTSLAVSELLGPDILGTLIQNGSDIPTFLANTFKHWKKTNSGQPLHSEMEAVNLGRMIHLELLCHETPKQALEQRPSLEVGLRRLYALLYVEETMNNGDYLHKKDAWSEIQDILETTPQGTVMSEDITDSVGKRLASKRRRLAAIKTIRENSTSRRRPIDGNPGEFRYQRSNRESQSNVPNTQNASNASNAPNAPAPKGQRPPQQGR